MIQSLLHRGVSGIAPGEGGLDLSPRLGKWPDRLAFVICSGYRAGTLPAFGDQELFAGVRLIEQSTGVLS